ncbi:MAG: hypothetical protein GY775_16760 [Candidatus Scalindua sp.]|nr:hypothetical protein [Candidatus Scalindua sp.]
MKFGHIKKDKVKVELEYDFPYLVMGTKPTEGHKVHKFWLKGENICKLLELNEKANKLSWMFDENKDNTFYLINITSLLKEGDKVEPSITLNLGLDFNNKPLFEKIEELTGIKTNVENYFSIHKDTVYDLPALRIEPIDYNELPESPIEVVEEAEAAIKDAFLGEEDFVEVKPQTIL